MGLVHIQLLYNICIEWSKKQALATVSQNFATMPFFNFVCRLIFKIASL